MTASVAMLQHNRGSPSHRRVTKALSKKTTHLLAGIAQPVGTSMCINGINAPGSEPGPSKLEKAKGFGTSVIDEDGTSTDARVVNSHDEGMYAGLFELIRTRKSQSTKKAQTPKKKTQTPKARSTKPSAATRPLQPSQRDQILQCNKQTAGALQDMLWVDRHRPIDKVRRWIYDRQPT